MKELEINADDFGLKPSVNRAIVDSLESELITSTTLMANMPGFEEAIELTHERNLKDKIGIHLVLTDGQPLTDDIRALTFLVDPDRGFRSPSRRKLFMVNHGQCALIYREYAAQIEKVRAGGIPISHMDTHHHMHEIWPILKILLALGKEYQIPQIRILNNLGGSSSIHKRTYRSTLNRYLRKKKVNRTDFFGSRVDYLNWLKGHPGQEPNGSIEVMVHPDYNSAGDLVDLLDHQQYDLDFRKETVFTS